MVTLLLLLVVVVVVGLVVVVVDEAVFGVGVVVVVVVVVLLSEVQKGREKYGMRYAIRMVFFNLENLEFNSIVYFLTLQGTLRAKSQESAAGLK